MKGSSIIELNHSAVKNNVQFLQNRFSSKTRISVVVKGNAYGHGIEQMVPMFENAGINHFSVFSSEEAERVCRIKKPDTEVMIMGWLAYEDMRWAIENEIQFYVFDLEALYETVIMVHEINLPAKIHLEMETGMNRIGFQRSTLKQLIKMLKKNSECFEIKGLCTHYAGAESIANHVRVKNQMRKFHAVHKTLIKNEIKPEICHTACSAAAMNYPETTMDMVRIGIMMYGFWPSPETFIQYVHHQKEKKDPLRRVIQWRSQVMTVKKVNSGEFISYGTTYLAQEDKVIAVVPVGYSDGFARAMSNHGRVLVNGQRVAVIGLVNMNMLIVDVSASPSVKRGDEVVIIGRQDELEISFTSFSDMSDTLNYESLVRIPDRIKRVIIDD